MKDKRNVCKLLFCIFILILLVHFFFSFSNDDVTYFSTILDTMSLKDFLIFRYSTWTSRILIEGLLVFISRNIYLWRVLDSCVMVLFIWCVQRLCFREIHIKSIIFTLLILLLLPFVDMTEAGFCATTMNYFWPLTFMLLSFLPIRDLYAEKKINKRIVPFYILASLYACNQEQCVCVVFAVSLISIVYFWKNKQKHWYPCFLLLISLLSLVFILSCPGNAIRSAHEIESWYLDYKNALFMDKIFLGVVSTTSILFSYFFVLLFYSFVLCISVIKQLKRLTPRVVAIIQLLIVLFLSAFRIFCIVFHKHFILFDYYVDIGHVFYGKNLLLFGFCILVFLMFIYLLLSFQKNVRFKYVIVFLLGCGTRLMMGFSPTIFASRSRTAIFLYFSLLLLSILLLKNIRFLLRKWEFNFIIIILFLFVTANIGVLFWKVL